MANYYVYILRCADGTLYTGSTTDFEARERTHNAGRGEVHGCASAGAGCLPRGSFVALSGAEAEAQLKRWTRAKKEALIAGDPAFLNGILDRSGRFGHP